MKKTTFLLFWLTLGAFVAQAGELIIYSDAYIWGQSARNTAKKGSALATSSGKTYSLSNVISKTDANDIDLLVSYAKIGKKGDKTFVLFAPGNPTLKMDWTKKDGTRPYCDMIASVGGDDDKEASLSGWTVRNETKIQKFDGDFNQATYETVANLKLQNTYLVNDVKAGDVFAFETAATSKNAGKKGLIKVISIEDDPDKPEKIGEGSYQKLALIIKVQQ